MLIRAVVPGYPPTSLVGSWMTTHEFLRHMAASGHRVEVHPFVIPGAVGDREGVTIRPDMGKPLAADVVIGHAGDDGTARRIAESVGAPLVLMVHGGNPDEIRKRMGGACLAVFNSETLRDAVACGLPSVVCPPPLDLAAYRTAPGDQVTLINLCREKGGGLFWDLAQLLPDREFMGVHGGYGRQLLFTGLGNVRLQRHTDRMVENVYSQTRVLLMPSQAESWGRVGLEAAASGIPTIAHPTPGIVECLGESAIYCDRDDIDAWVSALDELDDPGAYDKRSRLALERADAFDVDASLSRFQEAIECL